MDTDKLAKLRAICDEAHRSAGAEAAFNATFNQDMVRALLDIVEAAQAVNTYDGYVGCAPWGPLTDALAGLAEKIK